MPNFAPKCTALDRMADAEVPIPTEHAAGLLRSWTNRTVHVSIDASNLLHVSTSMRGDICEVEVVGDGASGTEWIEVRSDYWTLKANGAAMLHADDGARFTLSFDHGDNARTTIHLV